MRRLGIIFAASLAVGCSGASDSGTESQNFSGSNDQRQPGQINASWLIGTWVDRRNEEQGRCIDGPWDRFEPGGQFVGYESSGRWRIDGDTILISYEAATGERGTSAMQVTRWDSDSFSVQTDDGPLGFRRCSREELTSSGQSEDIPPSASGAPQASVGARSGAPMTGDEVRVTYNNMCVANGESECEDRAMDAVVAFQDCLRGSPESEFAGAARCAHDVLSEFHPSPQGDRWATAFYRCLSRSGSNPNAHTRRCSDVADRALSAN
jgi:hypothetical protein